MVIKDGIWCRLAYMSDFICILGCMIILLSMVLERDRVKFIIRIAGCMLIVVGIVFLGLGKETVTELNYIETAIDIVQMETGDYYIDTGKNYVFITRNKSDDISELILGKYEVEFKQSNDIKLVKRDSIIMKTKKLKGRVLSSDIVNAYKYVLYCDLR